LLLLAPFAPHITEELWERTGRSGSIHEQPWPDYDPRWLQRTLVTIVIQVNGKRRASIEAPPGLDKESAFAQARVVATVRAQLEGKNIRKLVYVQDRLLNIVVSEVANPG